MRELLEREIQREIVRKFKTHRFVASAVSVKAQRFEASPLELAIRASLSGWVGSIPVQWYSRVEWAEPDLN